MKAHTTITLLSITIVVLIAVNVLLLVAGLYLTNTTYQKLPPPVTHDDRIGAHWKPAEQTQPVAYTAAPAAREPVKQDDVYHAAHDLSLSRTRIVVNDGTDTPLIGARYGAN